jgi:putative transcriptional regulator
MDSLTSAGYTVLPIGTLKSGGWTKNCFDIAARKQLLIMIKIYPNIDVIPSNLIEELKLISYFFEGSPLIIGKETRTNTPLRDDVVYERKGIPAVNLTTFKRLIVDNQIFTISQKGGFYVKINGEKIHQVRVDQGYSLQEVASNLGVSRKAVYLFERMDQIKEENLIQLEELFKESFKFPVKVFEWEIKQKEVPTPNEETDFQHEIKEDFEDLGFDIKWVKKAPFDGITSPLEEITPNPENKCYMTGLSLIPGKRIYERLNLISELSKVFHKISMFIIDDEKYHPIDNVLILQKQILEKMKDIKELYRSLKRVKQIFY